MKWLRESPATAASSSLFQARAGASCIATNARCNAGWDRPASKPGPVAPRSIADLRISRTMTSQSRLRAALRPQRESSASAMKAAVVSRRVGISLTPTTTRSGKAFIRGLCVLSKSTAAVIKADGSRGVSPRGWRTIRSAGPPGSPITDSRVRPSLIGGGSSEASSSNASKKAVRRSTFGRVFRLSIIISGPMMIMIMGC